MATSYDYKGTKITGTSTTAKHFKMSGIKSAKVGDIYFNKETGHVYKCTVKGGPSDAKWKYIRTDIASKPGKAVMSLSTPTRQSGNRKMKATWKVPKSLLDKDKGDRAQNMVVNWYLGISGNPSVKFEKSASVEEHTIDLNNLKIGSKTYTRNSFYPETKTKLPSVTVKVRPHNSKGYGDEAKMTRKILAPRAPSIARPSFDSSNGIVSTTVETNAGDDHYERYDTYYKTTVTNTRTGGKAYVASKGSNSSTSFPLTFNAGDYQQMNPDNDYIKVVFEAWSRGLAGDTKAKTQEYYISYPKQPTIQGIDVSGNTSADRCTVRIKTNNSKEHPVDQVKLEYLADVPYATASAIPGTASWESTDIVDDATCTALTMPVGDLIPDQGNHTWVRIMSWHASENVLKRYSEYKEVTALYSAASTAEDDYVAIIDTTEDTHAGADGQSLVVRLGWDADGHDDSTGTELSWADEEDAWKSTKEPDSYEFSWEDLDANGQSIPVTYDGVTYQRSASITIKGLEEGEKYYIKARRFYEGDTVSYSPYSNMASRVTSEKPETVSATCARYVPTGSSLQVYWTLAGNGLQQEWYIADTNGTRLADGKGSIGSAQISADKLLAFANNGSITFTVHASTGSGFVESEEVTVDIVDPPELNLTVPATLTAQPFSFTATCTTQSDLIVILSSQGAVGQYPDGIKRQTDGDTIYSALLQNVEWTAGQNNLSTTIELPSGLDLWDGGHYTLEVTAIDKTNGLKSGTKTATTTVEWSHQAPSIVPTVTYSVTEDTEVVADKGYFTYDSETQAYADVMPSGNENPHTAGWYEQAVTECVTLTPIDNVDANGVHHQAVQISLTPPSGALSTDVYDIYRKVGHETYLIGKGFPLTHTAVDEYAPFGDAMTHEYRVAIQTADGDVSFNDIEYVLDGSAMRFDWATGSLELPYNISISDSYSKDVDVRRHMDGSMDGYWNQGVEHTGSLESDIIRLDQQDDIDSARLLAKYTGPVFVRTPDGSAYEADVQVSDMSTEGKITAIAIDATEIGLTQEFSLPTPFIGEEEE